MSKENIVIDIAIKPADITNRMAQIDDKIKSLQKNLAALKTTGGDNADAIAKTTYELERATRQAEDYGRTLTAALSHETMQGSISNQMQLMDQYWQYIYQGNQTSFSEWQALRDAQSSAQKDATQTDIDTAKLFTSEMDNVFLSSLTKTGLNMENFSQGFLKIMLDILQKQLSAALFSATANSLATPQSAATGGIAGFSQAAILSAAINAAFGIAKSVLSSGIKSSFAHGGLIDGPSHTNGGVKYFSPGGVVELEGGEAVINKKSTQQFMPLLSAINAAGGGVKFAQGGMLPPYNNALVSQNILNQMPAIDYKALAAAIAQMPAPVVAVEDINAVQTKTARIVNRASL
jgi:hypothetical protein